MFMKHVRQNSSKRNYLQSATTSLLTHYPTEVEGICQQKKTPRVIALPTPFPVKIVISNPLPKCVQISSPTVHVF